jgi:hypothetical protein
MSDTPIMRCPRFVSIDAVSCSAIGRDLNPKPVCPIKLGGFVFVIACGVKE